MATRTREQLIQEAADKLSIVGTGQTLEAEYREKINGNVDPLLAQLSAEGVAHVGNPEQIPAEMFDPLAGLLANVNAPLAGKAYDLSVKEYYERTLRRIGSGEPTYEVLEGTYF